MRATCPEPCGSEDSARPVAGRPSRRSFGRRQSPPLAKVFIFLDSPRKRRKSGPGLTLAKRRRDAQTDRRTNDSRLGGRINANGRTDERTDERARTQSRGPSEGSEKGGRRRKTSNESHRRSRHRRRAAPCNQIIDFIAINSNSINLQILVSYTIESSGRGCNKNGSNKMHPPNGRSCRCSGYRSCCLLFDATDLLVVKIMSS